MKERERKQMARAALGLCLGLLDPDRTASALAALTGDDWKRFVSKSIRHNVAAIAYRNLKGLEPAAPIPREALEPLREAYKTNTVAQGCPSRTGRLRRYRAASHVRYRYPRERR